MTMRFTDSDIEIHLNNWTEGMDITGIDEDASLEKACELVRATVQEAYPQYSVSVFTEHAYGASNELVRAPDIFDPDAPAGRKVHAYDTEAFLRQEIESRYTGLWDNFDAWVVETRHA